jgi:PKD repeat protein
MSLRSAFLLALSTLLFAGNAHARSSAGGDTSSTVTLFANFSTDVVGAIPNLALPAPPAGDALTINEVSGTVRVDAAIDGLTMAALLKQQSGAGGVSLSAWPAPAPAGTERVTIGWRSVAQDDNPGTIVVCAIRGSNGNVIASVEYGPHGSLTWNGAPLPLTYRQNRNNQFTVAVDLVVSTASLSADGRPVAGFQSVPFAQPATDVARVSFTSLGTSPQGFAVDDLFAVAFARIPDRAPIVSSPASAAVEELGHIALVATAADPDGDPIDALTADLSALPEGHGATFTASADNASGTLSWTPSLGAAGIYEVPFTATSNGLTGSATTKIYVAALGTAVTGRFVWTPQPGDEGSWSVTFVATDAGGTTTEVVPLTVLPADALLTAPAPSSPMVGTRALAPQSPMKGPLVLVDGTTSTKSGSTLTLTATATSDGSTALAGRFMIARSGSAAQSLVTLSADLTGLPTINDAVFIVDQDPIVTAPANVSGEAGTEISVNVGADDPDADPIAEFTADLSGLPAGNNAAFTTNPSKSLGTLTWTPTSVDVGDWTVTFRATNRLVGTSSTVIHVSGPATASIFTSGAKKLILNSGKPFYCVQIEPVSESFDLMDVDLTTIVMSSPGTGAVGSIAAAASKQAVIGDRDDDLIPDLGVCFRKEDLRNLFSLLRGNVRVPVTIEGRLTTGGRFAGSLSIDVSAGGGKLAASVSPNPLNPHATLRFMTTQGGTVRVRLFDASGRLVRELLPSSYRDAGQHEVAIHSGDASGRRLASGVYFYRVEAREGTSIGRIAVVK